MVLRTVPVSDLRRPGGRYRYRRQGGNDDRHQRAGGASNNGPEQSCHREAARTDREPADHRPRPMALAANDVQVELSSSRHGRPTSISPIWQSGMSSVCRLCNDLYHRHSLTDRRSRISPNAPARTDPTLQLGAPWQTNRIKDVFTRFPCRPPRGHLTPSFFHVAPASSLPRSL